jgi:hypothetical protein
MTDGDGLGAHARPRGQGARHAGRLGSRVPVRAARIATALVFGLQAAETALTEAGSSSASRPRSLSIS